MIETRLGLHFQAGRRADLDQGLRAAAQELGHADAVEFAARLVAGDFDRRHADALTAHLTVGETYFFRDPAAFEVLSRRVIPELVRERGKTRQLRIWSAGCCTGEEPYSLAIVLRQAIPDIDDWQISILATDINPQFLQKAAAGIYGRWSFRGVPEETRDAWFFKTPDEKFEVLPVIRKMVDFEYLNLVEDVYPALVSQTNAMDLIMCRNVLMYFSREKARKVVANLHHSLVEGGLLMVSPTETSQEIFRDYGAAEIDETTLYRKGPPLPVPMSSPVERPSPRPTSTAVAPHDPATAARKLANEGNLTSALTACDRALAAEPLVPAHHYLRGVILQEQGEVAPAATAMQRALYLDPDFIIGHFVLGHLLLRLGRTHGAERCFTNARSLLSRCDPDLALPEAEGMTAGRLLSILSTTEKALT